MEEQQQIQVVLSTNQDKLSKDLDTIVDHIDKTVHHTGEEDLMCSPVVPMSARAKLSTDLEKMLDQLGQKVEAVVTQVTLVRNTREELSRLTRNLQKSLKTCEDDPDIDEEHEKRLQTVSSDIQKREEMARALEKREILLSHSILESINRWVQELTGEPEVDLDHDLDHWADSLQQHHQRMIQPASEEVLECPLTLYKDELICKLPDNKDDQLFKEKPDTVFKGVKKRAPPPPKKPTN